MLTNISFSTPSDDPVIEELVQSALKDLMLDPKVWSQASMEVQCEVYRALQRLEKTAQAEKRSLPQMATFGDLIDILTKFYSIPHHADGSAATSSAKKKEVMRVRQAALEIAEQTLQEGVGFSEMDVVAVIAMFEENTLDAFQKEQDPTLIADVLTCLLRLLCTSLARSFSLILQGIGDMGLLMDLLRR